MTQEHNDTDLLHQALQQTLLAPPLPPDFRVHLHSRIMHESLHQVEIRRQELEHEHALALEQLRRGHIRLQRDTLAMVIGVAFAAGASAHLALPWLVNVLGGDSAITLPLLAITAALAAGASILPLRSH